MEMTRKVFLVGIASDDENVIPMGTGKTKEHDNRFKDF